LKSAEVSSAYTPVLHCGMAAVSFLPLTQTSIVSGRIPLGRGGGSAWQKQKTPAMPAF
jgi:hypothetical protein